MKLILVFVSVKNFVLFFTVQDSSFFCYVLEMAYAVGITTLSVFSHLTWRGISKTADKPVITVSIF